MDRDVTLHDVIRAAYEHELLQEARVKLPENKADKNKEDSEEDTIKICWYCKKMGHTRGECHARKRDMRVNGTGSGTAEKE